MSAEITDDLCGSGFTKWFNLILVEDDDGSRSWIHDGTTEVFSDDAMSALKADLERRMAEGTYYDWLRDNGKMMSRDEFNATIGRHQ